MTSGQNHPCWLGDRASQSAGRTRAVKLYPVIGPCVKCGNPKSERHHNDGNTLNNAQENVIILCRKCHLEVDGRLEKFIKAGLAVAAIAAAKAHRSKTHCQRGHPFSGDNLYINPNGTRKCRQCQKDSELRRRPPKYLMKG